MCKLSATPKPYIEPEHNSSPHRQTDASVPNERLDSVQNADCMLNCHMADPIKAKAYQRLE